MSMKKYEKILKVFVKATAQLEKLEEVNTVKAEALEGKKAVILGEAEAKAATLVDAANDLYAEGAAAARTIKKLKDLLF